MPSVAPVPQMEGAARLWRQIIAATQETAAIAGIPPN